MWSVMLVVLSAVFFTVMPTLAADESKVNAATHRVESGAKMIGHGDVGKGAVETAKGIGFTVVEGAKVTGEKFKEAGKAAGDSPSFPDGVKSFFTRLFTN